MGHAFVFSPFLPSLTLSLNWWSAPLFTAWDGAEKELCLLRFFWADLSWCLLEVGTFWGWIKGKEQRIKEISSYYPSWFIIFAENLINYSYEVVMWLFFKYICYMYNLFILTLLILLRKTGNAAVYEICWATKLLFESNCVHSNSPLPHSNVSFLSLNF